MKVITLCLVAVAISASYVQSVEALSALPRADNKGSHAFALPQDPGTVRTSGEFDPIFANADLALPARCQVT
jgi:hypothetical protein